MIKVGQRWLYKRFDSGYDDIWVCEITKVINGIEASIKILEVKRGTKFRVGDIFDQENFNRSVYSLLEGQDAPR